MITPSPGLPRLRLVLAVSLDGRLAPPQGGAAQIGGRGDRRVLEEALAWADGALIGAETLRRHGSTCLIHAPDLLEQRARRGLPPQPLSLAVSRSARLPGELPFFGQPLERWLLLAQPPGQADADPAVPASAAVSTAAESGTWPPLLRSEDVSAGEGQGLLPAAPVSFASPLSDAQVTRRKVGGFARVITMAAWEPALRQLAAAGLQRLVVLGGAALAASLLAENRLDELQLTLCPQVLGGEHTWLGPMALVPGAASGGWRLLEQRRLEGEELLLRYGREPVRPDPAV